MDLHDRLAADLERRHPTGPDLAGLTSAARLNGRRLTRRRRLAVVGGALAALAVGAVGIAALPTETGGVPDPPSAADRANEPPTPTPPPTADAREETAPATARSAVAALLSAIGEVSDGATGGYFGQAPLPQYDSLDYYAQMLLDDGGGLADVGLNVQLDGGFTAGCAEVVAAGCRSERLPDGGVLAFYEVRDEKTVGEVRRVVELVREDGVRVVASATNTIGPPGEPARVTRTVPPLTYAELRAVVAQDYWGEELPVAFLEAGEGLRPFEVAAEPGGLASTPTPRG